MIAVARSLRHRNYRLFFSGQSISLVGMWMTRLATSWLVYRLTGSPFLLGILGFDMPGRKSFLIQMVEDRADLGNAIALNSTMVNMARLVGPSIAGLTIAAVGEGSAS